MPTNPTTNEQAVLIAEYDIRITKSICQGWLKTSPSWLLAPSWAIHLTRVQNQNIFSCGHCLNRETGINVLTPTEDASVNDMLEPLQETVLERYVRTEHHIDVAGVDFTRFVSDAGETAYIRRDIQEKFALAYAYSSDRQVFLNDSPEASIIVAGSPSPEHRRLPYRELLSASQTEVVNAEPNAGDTRVLTDEQISGFIDEALRESPLGALIGTMPQLSFAPTPELEIQPPQGGTFTLSGEQVEHATFFFDNLELPLSRLIEENHVDYAGWVSSSTNWRQRRRRLRQRLDNGQPEGRMEFPFGIATALSTEAHFELADQITHFLCFEAPTTVRDIAFFMLNAWKVHILDNQTSGGMAFWKQFYGFVTTLRRALQHLARGEHRQSQGALKLIVAGNYIFSAHAETGIEPYMIMRLLNRAVRNLLPEFRGFHFEEVPAQHVSRAVGYNTNAFRVAMLHDVDVPAHVLAQAIVATDLAMRRVARQFNRMRIGVYEDTPFVYDVQTVNLRIVGQPDEQSAMTIMDAFLALRHHEYHTASVSNIIDVVYAMRKTIEGMHLPPSWQYYFEDNLGADLMALDFLLATMGPQENDNAMVIYLLESLARIVTQIDASTALLPGLRGVLANLNAVSVVEIIRRAAEELIESIFRLTTVEAELYGRHILQLQAIVQAAQFLEIDSTGFPRLTSDFPNALLNRGLVLEQTGMLNLLRHLQPVQEFVGAHRSFDPYSAGEPTDAQWLHRRNQAVMTTITVTSMPEEQSEQGTQPMPLNAPVLLQVPESIFDRLRASINTPLGERRAVRHGTLYLRAAGVLPDGVTLRVHSSVSQRQFERIAQACQSENPAYILQSEQAGRRHYILNEDRHVWEVNGERVITLHDVQIEDSEGNERHLELTHDGVTYTATFIPNWDSDVHYVALTNTITGVTEAHRIEKSEFPSLSIADIRATIINAITD